MLIQVAKREALPFEIAPPKIPNTETARVLKATDQEKGLIACKDTDELFDKVGI